MIRMVKDPEVLQRPGRRRSRPSPRLWRFLWRAADLKLSVLGLAMLFGLTLAGTLYQVGHGLYAAQERFFHSWIVLAWDFLPLPGGQAVLWGLGLNLLAGCVARVQYRWSNLGNILTHWGLLVLLGGALATYHGAKESTLPLQVGEGSNLSLDRRAWELSVWPEGAGGTRQVTAYGTAGWGPGTRLDFPEYGFAVVVDGYYRNARPAGGGGLEALPPSRDPEEDLPGAALRLVAPGAPDRAWSAAGGGEAPAAFTVGGREYGFALRRERHPLPFYVKLEAFKKEEHPGTRIAKSFESAVRLGQGAGARSARIYMNHPLHERDFTFYQASYTMEEGGAPRGSIFAVVRNTGRPLPYVASGLIGLGLLWHFGARLAARLRRQGGKP